MSRIINDRLYQSIFIKNRTTSLVNRKWYSFLRIDAKCFSVATVGNLKVGDRAAIERTITRNDLRSFAEVTQDWNPIHFTSNTNTPDVVHGAFLSGLVSAVMGTKLPGPGSVLAEQLLKFPNPCYVGETVLVEVEIISVRKIIECEFSCCVDDRVVLRGTAKVVINKNLTRIG